MIPFEYDPEILLRFPNLVGGAMLGSQLKNGPTSAELLQKYIDEQHRVLDRVGSTSFSEIQTLAGWRAAFRAFGVDPTQHRSAAEALLRRLTKKGNIPSINAVVDICNLVSIRYGLPVAAFDLRQVQGKIVVRFAEGDETFTALGETVAEHPDPGEVIFVDASRLVVARRWCWRQSEESASQEDTHSALFTIEAQHDDGRNTVGKAIEDLMKLLETYVEGQYSSQILPPPEAK